jgi:VIT1/CCC1 family predicted Fe2+/Mn2+ transporter
MGSIYMNVEKHRSARIGWLRAAVLGANDGIVSTASLIVGVTAAHSTRSGILISGVAGLVAGAMAMAAGEYVSVSSQSDTEQADLAIERNELLTNHDFEVAELADIYVARGLERTLAQQVAQQLMAHDALSAHARDELGISEAMAAKPVQASLASAVTFTVGAALPLFTVFMVPLHWVTPIVSAASLVFLATLGALAAYAGGASVLKGALRVIVWGALALGVSALVGSLFGAAA